MLLLKTLVLHFQQEVRDGLGFHVLNLLPEVTTLQSLVAISFVKV